MQTIPQPCRRVRPINALPQDLVIEASRVSAREMPRPHGLLVPFLALATVAALPGCATVNSHMPPAPLEPAPVAAQVNKLPPYRIQVGDVLAIRLLLNPELDEEVTVRPDGYISTTVAQNVPAYGLTVPELDTALRRDYSRQLTKPQVNVVVRSFAPTRIYVGGQVNNPGEFITVGPTLTLSQAIARAGGLRFSGDDARVFIIRRGPGDRPEFLSTSYNRIMHGEDPAADVRLAPYDVVYVPRTGVAEVYKFFNQYVQQFVPISWGFSYIVAPQTGAAVINPPRTTP